MQCSFPPYCKEPKQLRKLMSSTKIPLAALVSVIGHKIIQCFNQSLLTITNRKKLTFKNLSPPFGQCKTELHYQSKGSELALVIQFIVIFSVLPYFSNTHHWLGNYRCSCFGERNGANTFNFTHIYTSFAKKKKLVCIAELSKSICKHFFHKMFQWQYLNICYVTVFTFPCQEHFYHKFAAATLHSIKKLKDR